MAITHRAIIQQQQHIIATQALMIEVLRRDHKPSLWERIVEFWHFVFGNHPPIEGERY